MPYYPGHISIFTAEQENFRRPPEHWAQSTEATHWISVTLPSSDLGRLQSLDIAYTPAGDIYINGICTPLYSDFPYNDGSEIIVNLSHKTLVRVNSERVGRNGEWHFVTIVDTSPVVDGLSGYISRDNVIRLPNTSESLPMVFDTCIDKTAAQVQDLCSLNTPRWYEINNPYFDSISCEYRIPIITQYLDTGGDSLKARMDEHVPRGAFELLEYYDKKRSQEDLDRYFSAFEFAKATGWHMDVTSQVNSRLRVLVSIPAKYFDAIAQADTPADTQGLAGTITLNSSLLEKQINSLHAMMTRYQNSSSWRKVSYTGPEPDYTEFSFKREAEFLKLWLANFQRFLTSNRLGLRASSMDIFEIGYDDQFRIKYISATIEGLGSKNLKISFSRYIRQHPNSYPRTIAYISKINEIYNVSKSGEMPGGWASLINDYTLHKPRKVKNTSKKNKRCTSGPDCFDEKLKALGGDWDDFLKGRNWHKQDLKCDNISMERRFYLTPAGTTPTVWHAMKSGEFDDYKNQFAPFKTADLVTVDRINSQKWINELAYNLDLPSYDYVDDPFAAQVRELLLEVIGHGVQEANLRDRGPFSTTEGRSEEEIRSQEASLRRQETLLDKTGEELLDKVVYDVALKIDLKAKIREFINCTCEQIEQAAVNIEYEAQGYYTRAGSAIGGEDRKLYADSQALADGLRATAAALGCGNVCGVVPLLCACLPFEWPIRIKIPDDIPVVDIMAWLFTFLLNAILDAIIQVLVGLLSALLNWGLGKICKIKAEGQPLKL